MAKLTRVKGKVFAGSAPLSEIGQFGSALAGTPTNTQDVATIQALSAYDEGWGSGVISSRNYPPIEEVNGVLKTISYQTCYMLQEGIPEYDVNTEYFNTSIVKSVNGTRLDFYISLQNNNVGHALSDETYWAKATLNSGRNIGEIVTSTIPLSDAGLHLLDGSLIAGNGVYADFVSYIASIYDATQSYFATEADWQSSVSTYGVCGKFVYDSVNNTVRLPKITGFIEGTISSNALGNLTQAGLPNITGNLQKTDLKLPLSNTASFSRSGAISSIRTNNTTKSFAEADDAPKTRITGFNIDASASNSIYGKSATVQPQSVKVFYYIALANDVKNSMQVDIDSIISSLNSKAEVNFTNVNNVGTSAAAGWGMPSDTGIPLTLGPTGTSYVAPANGWVYLAKVTGIDTNPTFIRLKNETTGLISEIAAIAGRSNCPSVYIPVSKGDTFVATYDSTGAIQAFKFIYSNGSESEAS